MPVAGYLPRYDLFAGFEVNRGYQDLVSDNHRMTVGTGNVPESLMAVW